MLTLMLFLCSSAAATLTCSRSNSCPGSIITCVCVNAPAFLEWTVTLPGKPGCTMRYDRSSEEEVFTTLCEGHNHSVVLDAVGNNTFQERTYNSSLKVKLEENVTVMCDSNKERENATLTIASKHSSMHIIQFWKQLYYRACNLGRRMHVHNKIH